MDKTQLEALLGRPLTEIEEDNLQLYIDIAYENLDDLLCTTIDSVTETRVFDTREGYSTAFIGIFRSLSAVKINGETITTDDYSVRQWDKRNGSWYNSIVLNRKFTCDEELEVTGAWGFATSPTYSVPSDLQAVLAGLFALISKKNKYDGTLSSKQVEDFRVSFNTDVDLDEAFYDTYSKTISKYSICDIGDIQHGRVWC